MKKLMHILMLSCRKATELIEKKLLVGLSLREKIQLFIHTSMCDACSRYAVQSEELDVILKNHVENFNPKSENPKSEINTNLKQTILESLDE